jgi:hypothetical protein
MTGSFVNETGLQINSMLTRPRPFFVSGARLTGELPIADFDKVVQPRLGK